VKKLGRVEVSGRGRGGVPRRILLYTPSGVPEEVVQKLEAMGYSVEVVVSADLERGPLDAAERCGCYVVVPGSTPHIYPEGSRVVKGPVSPLMLPAVLEAAGGPEALSPRIPAEKALGADAMARVAASLLREAWASAEAAFEVGGLMVPRAPPPILVFSEVYVDRGGGVEALEARAALGADAVILGSASGPRPVEKALGEALERLSVPVGVDPGDPGALRGLAEAGASILMSVPLDPEKPPDLSWVPTGSSIVIIPPRPLDYGALELASWAVSACSAAAEVGVKAFVDPVVTRPGAPRGPLDALIALRLARGRGMRCPALLGVNNFYEMIDADTTGSIAVLVYLAGEAGASAVLASEESWKSRWATREARIAADMAAVSLYTGSPPKDLGFDLLPWKGKGEGEGAAGYTPCRASWRGLSRAPWRLARVDSEGRA
jgi:dihydropteroate synthase-like protein